MNHEELFVGAVSIILGSVALLAAVSNWEACYQFGKMRWIEAVAGRGWARAVYAVLGATLIALGVAIALGFGPNKSSASNRARGERGRPHHPAQSPLAAAEGVR